MHVKWSMILSDHFSLRLFLPKLTVHRTKLGVKFQQLIFQNVHFRVPPVPWTRKTQKLHNLNASQCLKNWSNFLHNEGII